MRIIAIYNCWRRTRPFDPWPIRFLITVMCLAWTASPWAPCETLGREPVVLPDGARPKRPSPPVRKPNIVIILADDLGYGDLSCYGATDVRTPNIDRLAVEGRRFTDAHSPASVCTPTRYNLLTGRYAWRTWGSSSCVWMSDPLLIEPGRLTVASLLKRQGYRTACVGKWHLGFGTPDMPGWDDVLGPDLNGELRPGPLEVGFDYFWGIPHVGQLSRIAEQITCQPILPIGMVTT